MGDRFHDIRLKSTLAGLLSSFIKAYDRRTDVIEDQNNNSVSSKLDAVIDMLRAGANVPADLALVKEELSLIHGLLANPQPKLEVRFMFVVKDDHQPVNFSLALGDVTDAEGNKIPDAQTDVAVTSSDDSVVAVSFDAAARTGVVSFGNPGVAGLTATVKSGDTLLGSGAADFTVTVGDPAAISSVGLSFDGLTEQ